MSFPAYPGYRESGVAWIGRVPAGWTVMLLKRDLAFITSGSRGWADFYADEGALFLRIGNLTRDALDLELSDIQRVAVPAGAEGERTRVQSGDVLFSITAFMGSVAVVPDVLEPAYVSQHVALARLRGRHLLPRWVGYAVLSSFGKAYLEAQSYGGTKIQLSLDDVREFPLAVPPLAEQQALVAFLDRECGKIDALVAEQERLIALLTEKRQAVISQAVTKGLDPNAPMKDSGVAWLGQVPAHWEVIRLRFLAQVQTGIAKGKDLQGVETVRVPYLRVANVQDGVIDTDDVSEIEIAATDLGRYLLRPGDVLMNEGGDFDKLGRGQVWDGAIDPCIHQNHVFAVRPHGIEPEWLALVTSADCGRFFFMTRAKQSTNLASISSTNLLELPVPCAPSAERLMIIRFLHEAKVDLDTLTTEATRAIALLRERRAALISAAVTGKIDVRGLVSPAEAAAA